MGDWILVEGQGSLDHPAYSSVTLGLIHGATPQAMVMVHKPGMTDHDFDHLPDVTFPIAPLPEFIALHEQVAGLVAPSKVVAVALNTSLYPRRRRGAPGHRRGRGADRAAGRRSGPLRGRPALGRPSRDARGRAAVGRGGVTPPTFATRSCTSRCATRSASPGPTMHAGEGVTTVIVELRDDRFPGVVGLGEGYPDRFYGETPETMAAVFPLLLEAIGEPDASRRRAWRAAADAHGRRHPLERRREVRDRHRPPRPRRQGRSGVPVHELLGLSADDPADRLHDRHRRAGDRRRAGARARRDFPALKIKVGGPQDLATLRAVRGGLRRADPRRREHRLDARRRRAPAPRARRASGVELIEQPFPARGLPRPRAGSRSARRSRSSPTRAP